MSYEIKLDSFEGPLDLLLHLIEKEEMDIYDIEIAKIADQYLHTMQILKLDDASDFLVMAATLLYIKSKMLLPVHPDLPISLVEIEEDPREELIKRLVEYKKYKYLSERLRELEIERSQIYTRKSIDLSPYISQEKENPVNNISIYDLITAFEKVLIKCSYRDPLKTVEREEFSVKDIIDHIVRLLKENNGTIFFSQLFDGESSRSHIVLTFLGLLELMKQSKIFCLQDKNFEDIVISYNLNQGEKQFGLQ
ncbi:MAG: ScpA family protein [Vulcanibacillus sp.]